MAKIRKEVEEFLGRDDNSRCNPGKQDTLLVKGEKVQTRVLTDYMYVTYGKFMSEQTDLTMSRALFYRLRPKHIRFSIFLKNNRCLCQTHQNTGLRLQGLRKALPVDDTATTSPDVFVDRYTTEHSVEALLNKMTCGNLQVQQWK